MKNESHSRDAALGYGFSNLIAFILLGLTRFLLYRHGEWHSNGAYIYSEFVIIPILMGLVCAWFWCKERRSSRTIMWMTCSNTFIAIALSFVFLKEGVICLLIVSPLIWCFMLIGVFGGISMFRKNNQNLNVSVVSLLLLVFLVDASSEHHYENMVADQIVINAPVSAVWKNVVAFKPIKKKNDYWLFRIGMPSPMATTVTGYYKGAGRKCIFSNGYVFGEKIVTFDPNQNLTFDIIDQPRDPEIMGHIDIERGQFLLKDNGNGTTTLTGNSWYKLYVFPTWYYDIWAKSITRNVHLRVMEHIKELSEAK